jgi:hypothetical protein
MLRKAESSLWRLDVLNGDLLNNPEAFFYKTFNCNYIFFLIGLSLDPDSMNPGLNTGFKE